MNTNRQSILFYEALTTVSFALSAGFMLDIGFKGTAFACAFIVVVMLIAMLCTWLGPNPDINEGP